jgi:hypothetical protein
MWFAANKAVLNLDKTNIMKFVINNSPHSAVCTGNEEKCIEEKTNIRNFILGSPCIFIDQCLTPTKCILFKKPI